MATENITNERLHPDGNAETKAMGPALISKVNAEDLQATFSAVGQVATGSLEATGSALGMTTVEGDATLTASAAPLVFSHGDATVQQSYASAVIAGGGAFTRIRQSAAPVMVGKTMEIEQSAAVAMVTGDAKLKKSWVGIIVAPSVDVSDDSRVLIETRGALIIAASILGGFALMTLAMVFGFRRASNRLRSRMSPRNIAASIPGQLSSISGQLSSQLQSQLKRLPDEMRDISQTARKVRERIGV